MRSRLPEENVMVIEEFFLNANCYLQLALRLQTHLVIFYGSHRLVRNVLKTLICNRCLPRRSHGACGSIQLGLDHTHMDLQPERVNRFNQAII